MQHFIPEQFQLTLQCKPYSTKMHKAIDVQTGARQQVCGGKQMQEVGGSGSNVGSRLLRVSL